MEWFLLVGLVAGGGGFVAKRWRERSAVRTTEREELERSYSGGHRNVAWLPADERMYCLRAGQGVYVPVHAPHWVRNGDAVSISLSITFQTAVGRRAQQVHMANARLRRLGLTPQPPGRRVLVDRAKAAVAETYGRSRRSL